MYLAIIYLTCFSQVSRTFPFRNRNHVSIMDDDLGLSAFQEEAIPDAHSSAVAGGILGGLSANDNVTAENKNKCTNNSRALHNALSTRSVSYASCRSPSMKWQLKPTSAKASASQLSISSCMIASARRMTRTTVMTAKRRESSPRSARTKTSLEHS